MGYDAPFFNGTAKQTMERIQEANRWLFLQINADAGAQDWQVCLAVWLAEYLIVLFFLGLLVYLLCRRRRDWRVWAVLLGSILLAAATAYLLREVWYHPRPFVLPLGTNFLEHGASSSFPSKHLTAAVSAAAALWQLPLPRAAAWAATLVAAGVAWSRIYLGVHWPLDMAGALAVGTASAFVAARLVRRLYPRPDGAPK